MPVFQYTAKDQSGSVTSGVIEAESSSRAAASLREHGLWVTDLRTGGKPARPPGAQRDAAGATAERDDSVLKKMWSRVSEKDLSIFYRQLYTMLNAGMPIYQSLEMLSQPEQTSNQRLRAVIQEMARSVLGGGRLSDVMARFPWLFDRMQVKMVEAGESGGLLVEILQRLADYLQREYELRLKIKQRTLYPKILLLAFIFIPSVPTLVLRGVFPFLIEVWLMVGGVLCIGIPVFLLLRYMLTTESGRNTYDQVKLAIPVLGPVVRKLAIARFARTFAALQGAGVPVASALDTAGQASGNFVLENAARGGVGSLERGNSITATLAGTRFFPQMFLGMVSTGESSGNLSEVLQKSADFYEEEALHAMMQSILILTVALLLIMGLIIGFRVVSFYTGFYGGIGAAGGLGE